MNTTSIEHHEFNQHINVVEHVALAADVYIPETPCPVSRSGNNATSNPKNNGVSSPLSTLIPTLAFNNSDFSKAHKTHQLTIQNMNNNDHTVNPSSATSTSVRREIADDFADFEMIGRKLSNVNLDSNGIKNETSNQSSLKDDLASAVSLHRAFQSQVAEYQFNAMKQLRSTLCDEKVHEMTEVIIKEGFLGYFKDCLSAGKPHDLQYETCWCITNIAAGKSSHTQAVVNADLIPSLASCLYSSEGHVRSQAAWALGNIAGDCGPYRNSIIDTECVPQLLRIWEGDFADEQKRSSALHVTVWCIANLCRWKHFNWDKLSISYPFLKNVVLLKNDLELLSESCWALSRIFHSRDVVPGEWIDYPVCERLVQLLKLDHINVTTPILRAVTNIISSDDDNPTQMFIDADILPELKRLLLKGPPHVRLEVLLTLSNITAGRIDQIQKVIEEGFIPIVVDLMKNYPEFRLKKEACWTLSNAVVPKEVHQVRRIAEEGVLGIMINFLSAALQQEDQVIWKATQCIVNILEAGNNKQRPQRATRSLRSNPNNINCKNEYEHHQTLPKDPIADIDHDDVEEDRNIYVDWLRCEPEVFKSLYASYDLLRQRQQQPHQVWSRRSFDLMDSGFRRWFGDLTCEHESLKFEYFQMLNAIEKVSIS